MTTPDARDLLMQDITAAIDARAVESLEATMTQRIIKRLCPAVTAQMLREQAGSGRAQLNLLDRFLPRLPLTFIAHKAPWLHKIEVAELLGGHLRRTPLFRTFSEYTAKLGIDPLRHSVGMLLPWPDAPTMVFHNWPHQDETIERHKAYGRFVFVSSKRQNAPVMYVLEPLDGLLDVLDDMGFGETAVAV